MIESVRKSLGILTRTQRWVFWGLVGARILVNLLDVAGLAIVGLLGAMLASGLTERESAEFLGFRISIESSNTFLWVVAAIAGFFIAKSVLSTVLLRMTGLFLARTEGRVAVEVVRYIFSGPLSRLKEFSAGDLQWTATHSTQQAMTGLLTAFSATVSESALFVSVFVVFLLVDSTTALLISAYFLLLIALFQGLINKRLKRIGERLEKNSVIITDTISDLASAFRETGVLGTRGFFIERFADSRRRFALDWVLQNFLMGLPRFFVESALMVGVMALVAWQFFRGNLSEGIVVTAVFLTGGMRMMAALLPLQNAVALIKFFGPQASVAQSLVARTRSEKDQESGTVTPSAERLKSLKAQRDAQGLSVEVAGVSFSHADSETPALQDVSLSIQPGAYVALVGPSGSGKTTLADIILGLYEVDSGEVLVEGVPPTSLISSQPGLVGYVPQLPGLVSGTIAENILLGRSEQDISDEDIWKALRKAELEDYVLSLPQGIHTPLGKQKDTLSGGQRQRLGLARALFGNPRLLILDEATSALDAGTEASVSDTIRRLGDGVTVIVIAHRLSTIQHADEVFVMESSRIMDSGRLSDLRKRTPMIEDFIRLMSID